MEQLGSDSTEVVLEGSCKAYGQLSRSDRFKLVDRSHLRERQLDPWVLVDEAANASGEGGVDGHARVSDRESTLLAAADPANSVLCSFDPVENGSGLFEQSLARLRQLNLSSGSGKQAGAQLGLELSDRNAEGWLGHVEATSGSSEVQLLRDYLKVSKDSEIHL